MCKFVGLPAGVRGILSHMYSMRSVALSALLGGFIFTPLFAFAQTSTTTAEQPVSQLQQQIDQLIRDRMNSMPTTEEIRASSIRNYLEVKTIPETPGPSEMVRVSIESYLTDLNKATISWSLNGKVVDRGVGRKSFSFQNGPSGKTTRLTISITTNAGEYITKEFSWNPVGLTILWEADTYTPPFYKGKALLTAQANVKAVAIPDNTDGQNALSAGNFVYVWEKDGVVVSESSGYGKNFFSFTAPKPYGDAKVKVKASSVNNSINSETRVNLSLSQPVILFYEKSPLLGVLYNQPFGSETTLSKKEFTVVAEPYFFSREASETPAFKYDWAVNNKATQSYGRSITLRNDTGVKGESAISLSMRGLKQTFQNASKELRVQFTGGETSDRPIF